MSAAGKTVPTDWLKAGSPPTLSVCARPSQRSLRSKAHTLKQEPARRRDTGARRGAGWQQEAWEAESSAKQRETEGERRREEERELQQRPGGPASRILEAGPKRQPRNCYRCYWRRSVQTSRRGFPGGRCPQALLPVKGDLAGLVCLRCQNTEDQRASWGEAGRHEMPPGWTPLDGGSKCEKKSFPAPVQPDSYPGRKQKHFQTCRSSENSVPVQPSEAEGAGEDPGGAEDTGRRVEEWRGWPCPDAENLCQQKGAGAPGETAREEAGLAGSPLGPQR